MARVLRERSEGDETEGYTRVLSAMGPAELRALGEEYLERCRIHRKTTAPFFIDKMPNNFLHAGLIHLMLPRAKIIDTRRHPALGDDACRAAGLHGGLHGPLAQRHRLIHPTHSPPSRRSQNHGEQGQPQGKARHPRSSAGHGG